MVFVVKDKLLSYNINTYTDLNINVANNNVIKEWCDERMSTLTDNVNVLIRQKVYLVEAEISY